MVSRWGNASWEYCKIGNSHFFKKIIFMTPNELTKRLVNDLEIIAEADKSAKGIHQMLAEATLPKNMKVFAADASISAILIGTKGVVGQLIKLLSVSKKVEELKIIANNLRETYLKVNENSAEIEAAIEALDKRYIDLVTGEKATSIVREVLGNIHDDAYRLNQAKKAKG